MSLSYRGNKKIPTPNTWESLEFNLDVGSHNILNQHWEGTLASPQHATNKKNKK
jgi:hypothetical protein